MVNQKLISLKLDLDLLDQIDSFCSLNKCKRNRVINDYLRIGLANLSHYAVSRLVADHCHEYGFDWQSLLNSSGFLDF